MCPKPIPAFPVRDDRIQDWPGADHQIADEHLLECSAHGGHGAEQNETAPVGGQQKAAGRTDIQVALIAIDELSLETTFAVTFGVGTDLRVPLGPASLGVRLEVSDNVHGSPIDVLVVPIDRFRTAQSDTRLDFGYVHNLRAAAGLVLQFGR